MTKSFRQSAEWRMFLVVLKFFIITFLAAMMFLPFAWMVCTAFKSSSEVEGAHFWPKLAEPDNFRIILRMIPDKFTKLYLNLHLWRWIFNSVFIASWVVTLQVITSSLAAYAFSRIEWKGRDKVFLLYLATMMIPGLVLTIPQFQLMVSDRKSVV